MAMRLSCGINLPPANLNSFQISPQAIKTPKTQPQFMTMEAEETKLRKKNRYGSVLGIACIVMGVAELRDLEGAAASPVLAPEVSELARINSEGNHKGKGIRRWSEKRGCPSWRTNSFETIVPENLPRPSARRRWESVGIGGLNDAPPVNDVVRPAGKADCFSM